MKNKISQKNIPDGWTGTTLGGLMEFKNGLNKEKSAFGAGTPIVNYTDVYKKTSLEGSDVAGLVTVTKNELVNNSAQKGDVFFTRTSETLLEIGMSSVLLDDIKNCVFSGYILRGRPKSNDVLSKYYAHSLRTPSIRKEIMRKSSMTTRALTTGKFLGAVEYSYPPEKEQGRIIKTLDTWDEAIEKLDRIIKLKKSVKKGLMQKLLTGELRLPGFKDEWQETLLNEVVTFAKGNVLSKADLDSEGKYECIHYGELFTKYGEVITSVISRTNKDVKVSKSESGDVLMPTSDVTPRGLATASCINKKGVVIGGDTLVLRPKKNIDGNFLSFYINSHKKDVMKLVSGTTVFHLYGSGMKKMKIKYPTDVEEQKQIAEVIISVNKQIKTLEKKMSYFQEQKKHLLNNLVTGQIRTPENL
jgi:type I restriction enzyme S subunit